MSKTILVIDDDEVVRTVLSGLLVKQGYSVATHGSGFGLASAVWTHKPDLMTLDLGMPGLSGDVATRGLRALAERWQLTLGPVVVYSALPTEELAARAEAIGAANWVSKSRGPVTLLDVIRDLLSGPLASASSKAGWESARPKDVGGDLRLGE